MPRKLIQIDDGLFVMPHAVNAVRASSLDDKTCSVFMRGQSATEGGFVVKRELEEVVSEINEALEEEEDE